MWVLNVTRVAVHKSGVLVIVPQLRFLTPNEAGLNQDRRVACYGWKNDTLRSMNMDLVGCIRMHAQSYSNQGDLTAGAPCFARLSTSTLDVTPKLLEPGSCKPEREKMDLRFLYQSFLSSFFSSNFRPSSVLLSRVPPEDRTLNDLELVVHCMWPSDSGCFITSKISQTLRCVPLSSHDF